MIEFHPAFILIIGAIIAAVSPQRIRQVIMVAAPSLAVLAVFGLSTGTTWTYPFVFDHDLVVLHVDELSWVFALIFSIICLLGNIYALHIKRTGEAVAGLLYPACALGVTFAGDWVTFIAFWEVMAVASVFLIWYRARPESLRAGFRYFMVHTFGGQVLLAGVFILVLGGEPYVGSLIGTEGIVFWLMLIGIAINAAIPPLHAWLTDAYPEGTITGSVFLSAFTTKVAVYSLLRAFPGLELLLWAGVIMAVYGVIFAILENDIRRLLAYHIVSQVGFMVAGIGIGTELAMDGATAHAYSHILYKALLFMGAGAVIYSTGCRKLTDLGGIYHKVPLTALFFTIGAFSISGVPIFNGFISKSMTISAAAYANLPAAEFFLHFASIGTFLSIALKLNYFMFFGPKRDDIEVKPATFNMNLAMGANAFLCTLYGLYPMLLYVNLPFATIYEPWTLSHFIEVVQLLIATTAGFWLLMPIMQPKAKISLDFDWFYRKPLYNVVMAAVYMICDVRDDMRDNVKVWIDKSMPYLRNPFRVVTSRTPVFNEAGPVQEYNENRYRFPSGVTVLASILAFVVLVSYVIVTFDFTTIIAGR